MHKHAGVLFLAPMIRRTDRHFRYLVRLISKKTVLFSEMITAQAVCFGAADKLLRHHAIEPPLVIQLAGADPKLLARASVKVEQAGCQGINLNVGCPSDRVQSGQFGVCLMKRAALVADLFSAMSSAVQIPVSIKTRIGVDDLDSESFFFDFIETCYQAGCRSFFIHARKAWLNGLSPKENRSIPPLIYPRVYRLKQRFPDAQIVINGGINDEFEVCQHLSHVDGVMLGRAAYQDPFLLARIEKNQGWSLDLPDRQHVLLQLEHYCAQQESEGVAMTVVKPHLMGLLHKQCGGKRWRQCLGNCRTWSDLRHLLRAPRQAML